MIALFPSRRTQAPPPAEELLPDPGAFVEAVVADTGREPQALIPILQAVQRRFRYLPPEALHRVAELTRSSPADIMGVATFYSQFRTTPVGRHMVSVCHGTACHVKGSMLIDDALRRHLQLGIGDDTDRAREFTLQKVACVGCCTLAPVIQIDGVTYGNLKPETAPKALRDFLETAGRSDETGAAPIADGRQAGEIRITIDSCCIAGGALQVHDALVQAARLSRAPVAVKPVTCGGMCHQIPLVEVAAGRREPATYAKVTPQEAEQIVRRHFPGSGFGARLRAAAAGVMDRLVEVGAGDALQRHSLDVRDKPVCAFLGPQRRIATEQTGSQDPMSLEEYRAAGGYEGLRRAITEMTPEGIVDTMTRSGLRGRGGAGFPTGIKWGKVRQTQAATKYVVVNGDEGDPGAFMDRMLLESFPYRVLEGLTIAARAVGAEEGYLYIRAEYPHAVTRIREAIRRCEAAGLLGNDILGSGARLSLTVMEGAGAFVCGEETALIASIEGRRGMPTLRPPYPAESGLWGMPTLINNVETYAMVPWIVRHGWEAFAGLGTEKSRGTKVFALAGKVRRGGLIEVPMGVTIRQVVDEIGGGVSDGGVFKAVQMGGPSGGCIPAAMADTPVDYDALQAAGAIMGSGGMVVLDDRTCMVDIARYFLEFTQHESCGKCTFCRLGTRRMLDILERLCRGEGRKGDIEKLEELSGMVKAGSICGLGQTAPNPVLSTLRYFREEYEAHVQGRCPAEVCRPLVHYTINQKCIGCTKCAQDCPVDAIAVTPFEVHAIDDALCTRCDACRRVCPVEAVELSTGREKSHAAH